MAFMPAGSTVSVTMQYTAQGQHCVNVYHVEKPGAKFTVAQMTVLAQIFRAWEDSVNKANRSSSSVYTGVSIRGLRDEEDDGYDHFEDTPIAGTKAASNQPMNVAICVTWKTGVPGRSNRGRTYPVGPTGSDVVNSAVPTATQTSLLGDFANIMGAVISAGYHMVVLSRQFNHAPRDEAKRTNINGVGVDPRSDSMKRRLIGRGT